MFLVDELTRGIDVLELLDVLDRVDGKHALAKDFVSQSNQVVDVVPDNPSVFDAGRFGCCIGYKNIFSHHSSVVSIEDSSSFSRVIHGAVNETLQTGQRSMKWSTPET